MPDIIEQLEIVARDASWQARDAAGLMLAVGALLIIVALAACILTRKPRKTPGGRLAVLLLPLVAVAVLYGGSKRRSGTISFPYTDVEQRYLVDSGSYVTNDAVYVAFSRIIAPATAPLFIDRRQVDQTNDVDWVNILSTTFAEFNPPQTIQCPAATNWDWIVYTTWTPGPTVQTNGVWHAYWGVDQKSRSYFIPVRTCVRDGATIIATPKSRWDATNTTNNATK